MAWQPHSERNRSVDAPIVGRRKGQAPITGDAVAQTRPAVTRPGRPRPTTDRLSRRRFLKVAAVAGGAGSLSPVHNARAAGDPLRRLELPSAGNHASAHHAV